MTKTNQPQTHISYWEKPILFMAKKVREDHPNKPLTLYFKEHEQGGWLYVAPEGSNLAKNGKQIMTIEQLENETEQGKFILYREELKFPKNTKVLIPINKLDEKQPFKELLDSFDSSAFVFYNIAKNKMYIEDELRTFEKETHFMHEYINIIPEEEYNHLMIGYLLREVRRDKSLTLHQFINKHTDNISFLSHYLEKTIITSEDYTIAYDSDYNEYETGLLAIEIDAPKENEALPQNIQWAKDGFRFEALVEKFRKPITYMLSELGDESSPDELNLMYDFEYDYLILAYEAPSEFTPSLNLGSVPASLAKTNPYEAFDKLLHQTAAKCLHYWPEYTPKLIIQSDLINQEGKAKKVIDQIYDFKRLQSELIDKNFIQSTEYLVDLETIGGRRIFREIETGDVFLDLDSTPFRTWVKIFQNHPYFTTPNVHFTPGGDALGGRYDGIFE